MSVDSRLERAVLTEFALWERRERRRDRSRDARILAEALHRGSRDLLMHLRRVASAVPNRFRAVAWLHHSVETDVTLEAFAAAGLRKEEVEAIELLAYFEQASAEAPVLLRVRALLKAPGLPGYLARVVARAAIEERLDGQRPCSDTAAALLVLPDPQLAK
jgi:hypothetical protein